MQRQTNNSAAHSTGHVAFFLRALMAGGVERVMINLAGAMAARGYQVDLVVGRLHGPFVTQIPNNVRVIDLRTRCVYQALPVIPKMGSDALRTALTLCMPHSHWILGAVPRLAEYLRNERPHALLSGIEWPNIAAILARRLACIDTRLVIGVHDILSARVAHAHVFQRVRAAPALVRRYYPQADAIVAVSKSAASDTVRTAAVPPERVTTIYNPVVDARIPLSAQQMPAHPWFYDDEPPIVLAAGRLKPEKDFPSLLRAFALVRAVRPARLVILGEGWQRPFLRALVRRLGLVADVSMPGFVANPFAYMARARLFVISSLHEGFANVIPEALACGCPVISTNCPGGPSEILENGNIGTLVPVGDAAAMAAAILQALDTAPDRERLRRRAADFSIDTATDQYLDIMLPQSVGR